MIQRQFSNKRIRVLVGLFLAAGLLIQYQRAMSLPNKSSAPVMAKAEANPKSNMAFASVSFETPPVVESLEDAARRDPMGFIQDALDQYDRSIRDYTCTFSKQELVNRKMTKEQVMEAMFREEPFSVRLKWIKNEDKCSRVLYVADRWVDKDNQQLAVVEPGPIARIFVSHVMRPIAGRDARKASRRTINQFGLRNSLHLTLKYCKIAQDKKIPDFNFKYVGNGKVEGHETLIFERHLPYTGEDGIWPDRVLVVHIDKELLLPRLCTAYADDQKTVVLGRYMTSKIKLNANLPDSIFTKKGMGL
ncbi:MAG: DUF1571 domain-containing protein [Planctomycetota bacterium]|nr:MAG: DUF1571 domain-containing protein [Planctomycetota bacterium]